MNSDGSFNWASFWLLRKPRSSFYRMGECAPKKKDYLFTFRVEGKWEDFPMRWHGGILCNHANDELAAYQLVYKQRKAGKIYKTSILKYFLEASGKGTFNFLEGDNNGPSEPEL